MQIGHAVEEKKLLDALLLARDHPQGCLYSAVTDCGAGGLSSAVGEMGAKLGAVVDVDKVPLKYAGLRYDEIWISEAQERMVFAVPPERIERLLELFACEEVEATVIGTFADDRVLRVRYKSQTVGELDMAFLHEGLPKQTLSARWTAGHTRQPPRAGGVDESESRVSGDRLLRALGELNTASKEWVIRQYDHEVQGRSVVKPLVGPAQGPSDAAVLRPRYDSHRGMAVGCGLCPELGDVDPYWMAVAAVDEALRNVICVGGNPDQTAILDNFCWPKVDTEKSLGALVRACVGARDVAIAYGLPFISGKDSLNNEFSMSAEEAKRTGLPQRIAVPYTLLISALGIVDDVRRCVSMDLKEPGDCLVVASAPAVSPHVDLSHTSRPDVRRDKGADSATVLKTARTMHHRVAELIRAGKVRAAHDVSDGGLAVAIAEMCIASILGATVKINADAYCNSIFAPVTTTYVLEMTEADAAEANLPVIGRVESKPRLRISCDNLEVSSATAGGRYEPIDVPVDNLAEAWRSPLAHGGGP